MSLKDTFNKTAGSFNPHGVAAGPWGRKRPVERNTERDGPWGSRPANQDAYVSPYQIKKLVQSSLMILARANETDDIKLSLALLAKTMLAPDIDKILPEDMAEQSAVTLSNFISRAIGQNNKTDCVYDASTVLDHILSNWQPPLPAPLYAESFAALLAAPEDGPLNLNLQDKLSSPAIKIIVHPAIMTSDDPEIYASLLETVMGGTLPPTLNEKVLPFLINKYGDLMEGKKDTYIDKMGRFLALAKDNLAHAAKAQDKARRDSCRSIVKHLEEIGITDQRDDKDDNMGDDMGTAAGPDFEAASADPPPQDPKPDKPKPERKRSASLSGFMNELKNSGF